MPGGNSPGLLPFEDKQLSHTFELQDGYFLARRKNPVKYLYRHMTLDEIKALRSGSHVEFIARDGTARMVKINGQVKRWVRQPDKIEVPVKYGMYETHRMGTQEALQRLVVRVTQDADLQEASK